MIAIVDYDAGNLTSVRRALDHLSVASQFVSTGDLLSEVAGCPGARIIFPGVGHAAAAMRTLQERGLDAALGDAFRRGVPILGICLGAQIILSRSEEGDTPCLDLLPGRCPRFELEDASLKVPHMGWNEVEVVRPHPLLQGLAAGDSFYFVHSYYPRPAREGDVLATSDYGVTFPAVIGHGNLVATQFNPEKSGRVGLSLLRRFAAWDGTTGSEAAGEADA